MIRYAVAGVVLVSICTGNGLAQGPRRIVYGAGERLALEAELPPEGKRHVKEVTGRDLSVGFLYEYWFLGTPGIDVWTCNGRYVLFDQETYYALTDEELRAVLGTAGVDRLGKPFRYRFPSVLIGVAGIISFSIIQHYRSARYRAEKSLKLESHQDALREYQNVLPAGEEWTQDYRRAGLAAAVACLVDRYGIDAATAETSMRELLGEIERSHSAVLRQNGAAYESAGEWMAAAECYQEAADMMALWDPEDAAFLERCVDRVIAQIPKT